MLIKRNDVFINPSLKLLKYITKKKTPQKPPTKNSPTKPHQKLNINLPPLREPDPPPHNLKKCTEKYIGL